MYEQVFHFNSRPFTATPFVKHYFAGRAIDQALNQSRSCIDRASGPVVVIGGAGTGKSLLLAMLEEDYQAKFNVVNLGCSRLSDRQDLLQSVMFELKQPFQGLTDTELRFSLIDYLKPSERCPHGILLLIDEAHSLPVGLLDEIRLITNFVRDGQPRVRLVMAGNQRLEETLNDPKLESFNQRIAARCYLQNMSRDETARYVIEHIDRAGGNGAELFDTTGLHVIHELTDGCPRLVNQICDHALILAATRSESIVTEPCVRESWADVQSIPGSWPATNSASSTSQLEADESWTVIEFGQLDEEPDGSSGSPSQTAADTEETQQSAAELELASGADNFDQELVVDSPSTAGLDASAETENPAVDNQNPAAQIESPVEETRNSEEPVSTQVETAPSVEHPFDDNDSDSWNEDVSPVDVSHFEDEDDDAPSLSQANPNTSSNADSQPENETNLAPLESDARSRLSHAIEAASDFDEPENQQAPDDQRTETPAREVPEFASDTDVTHSSETDSRLSDAIAAAESDPIDPVEANDSGLEDTTLDSPFADATDDPFAETFADEENLVDRYAPFVAHQNQSSLSVSAQELELLKPDEEPFDHEESVSFSPSQQPKPTGDENANDDSELLNIQDSELEADTPSEEVSVKEPEDSDHALRLGSNFSDGQWNEPTEEDIARHQAENEMQAEAIHAEENRLHPAPDSDSAERQQERSTVGNLDPAKIEETQLAGPDLSSPVSHPLHAEGNAPESAQPAAEQHNEQVNPAEVAEKAGFHSHVTEASSRDIERQAAEILKRLNISQSVSHETKDAESVKSNSDMDDSRSSSHSDTPAIAPPLPVGRDNRADTASLSMYGRREDSELEQQESTLDETQQILNEILEQKSMLAHQQEHADGSNRNDNRPKTHPNQPENSSESKTNVGVNHEGDDRDMIVVNQMDQPADDDPPKDQPIAFPSTPVSTGRAERMDYQRLFDQLRQSHPGE